MLTKQEIEDVEVVYRAFCGDGRILTDLEQTIIKKLKTMISNYCNHDWDNCCCGCSIANIYCSTCNITLDKLTTNLVEIGN